MSLKWRSLFFSQDGQPTDLVSPEAAFAKRELCSARSAGIVMGEELGRGRADVCCMLINAAFLLQNRSPLVCRHGNANKHLTLPLFFPSSHHPRTQDPKMGKYLGGHQIPSLPSGKTVPKLAPTTWGHLQDQEIRLSLPMSP